MSLDIYFISEQTIKDKTGVSNAVDGKQLKPAIKIAQGFGMSEEEIKNGIAKMTKNFEKFVY
jgi:DNA-binding transcriptional regulator YhcF (GntR family)